MKKIGLFLGGQLMEEYQNNGNVDVLLKAVDDLRFAIEETGVMHELKYIEVEEVHPQ